MIIRIVIPVALAMTCVACNDTQQSSDAQSSAGAVDVDPDMPEPPSEPSAPPDASPQPIPVPPDARPQR